MEFSLLTKNNNVVNNQKATELIRLGSGQDFEENDDRTTRRANKRRTMESQSEKVRILVCTGGTWEVVNGDLEYMPSGLMKRTLRLPLELTYLELMDLVARKLNLDAHIGFKLSYKVSPDVIEVVDDDDVLVFIDAVNMSHENATLFVVESVGSSEGHLDTKSKQPASAAPATVTQRQYQTKELGVLTAHVHGAGYKRVREEHQFGPRYEHVPKYRNAYGAGTSQKRTEVIELDDDDDGADVDVRVLVGDQKLSPFGDKVGNPLTDPRTPSWMGLSNTYDRDEYEWDESIVEDGIGLKNKEAVAAKVATDDFRLKTRVPLFCNCPSHVALGQIFENKEDLKLALGMKCVEEGFEIKPSQSSKDMLEFVCLSEKCGWLMRAIPVPCTERFEVTTLNDWHTCSKTQTHNHPANKKGLLKRVMFENNKTYGREIDKGINKMSNIKITYSQAWRAKCYVLQLLRSSPEESFAQLPVYCHNLKKTNPGTITHIKTNKFGQFQMFFVAIGVAIRTFLAHMRPLIVIKGARLKGKYLETMFLVQAMDGNNQLLPIAYGLSFTDSDNSRTWTWFLTKVKECIGVKGNLAIISDGVTSIDQAIRRVFPNVYHGISCSHLSKSLGLKSNHTQDYEGLFWKACKTYRVSVFQESMNALRSAIPQWACFLDKVGYAKWARSHFSGLRFNVMSSNSEETVNALSQYARRLPITMLIDFFRSFLQQWFFEHRHTGAEFQHKLAPWAEAKIRKRSDKSATWTVFPVMKNIYKVEDDQHETRFVDLLAMTCGCKKWQLSGLPCGHFISVMRHLNCRDYSQWFPYVYTTDVYRASYQEMINPVGHPSEWELLDGLQTVKPPLEETANGSTT